MKQMSFFICLFFACLLCMPLKGQIRDSLERDSSYTPLHHHIWNSKAYQITHIGAPLILAGVLTYHKDKAFQNIRNSYIPRFRFHYDDYLQYSPGIVMLGLKSFGVEGRSSWGRMLTSDAFSAGIMALTVNTLKSTIHKERPDKSADNSFPSGHTATAFMFATMLHKEYGTTHSPLYSVLGYSLATGTALSRQMNNKHWFSDVLTGAGIGIVSTELGYYLADLIFKNKGIVRPPRTWNVSQDDSYSFFGLQMGYNIGEREMHLPEGIEIEGMGGAIASFNGAWFFRSHWGVGGKFTVAQTSPHVASDRFFSYHPETVNATDYEFVITHPEGYELAPQFVGNAKVEYDQMKAFEGADFIYAKNWAAYTGDNYGQILSKDRDWTVSDRQMAVTNNAYFMHCLPVRRNMIVTDDVIESPQSIVIPEAANREISATVVLKRLLEGLK